MLREIMERSGIVEWMIPQLTDPRRREDVVHDLASLIRTSVLLAAQGWRDHDDADALRDDPAFRLAASSASGRTPLDHAHGLASQPTLSRFTAIMAEPSNRSVLRKAALELGARAARAERGGKQRRWLTLNVASLLIDLYRHQPEAEWNGACCARLRQSPAPRSSISASPPSICSATPIASPATRGSSPAPSRGSA